MQGIDGDIGLYGAFVFKDQLGVPVQNDDKTWEIYATNERLLEILKKRLKLYGLEIINEVKVGHL
ncbi:hypothetical protein M0Q50_00480 [bacterium]|nr:hypothetical protein [bacterium]